jgi:hypothetical protein
MLVPSKLLLLSSAARDNVIVSVNDAT